ncbi:Membrane bound protein complex subunit mbxF [Marinitoga hydrogenitolerans DSM 16785]|uniref:Membrane bound protein complex subunit mbxF n=2 Tax=Marinitoga TaxID=160798 RepID=A0A1M4W7I4_MARH1|nr:Na(+)/H(+) antiporter subunit B [Marinitoga hydrogenitolerans]SHE76932.1 Membrane bound protein complex subunit mbxF [Marinitoga hydrogenitolerans DSM 16785]
MMKRFIAALIVLVLGIFIFTNLYSTGEGKLFPKFGEVNLSERVSNSFVNKNVSENSGEVKFKETKNAESGSANMVTSIVVNYRSFDTLGEVTVLFVSALGVGLLLSGNTRMKFKTPPNFILKTAVRIISGIILITGVYIFIHGHLTPGGGFPGGSMIASAVLLFYLSDDEFRTKVKAFKVLEGTAGSLYLIFGLLGISLGGYFLYNFLPTGTVGELFSAGIVPIIYIFVGLKVGSELSNLISDFLSEEGK